MHERHTTSPRSCTGGGEDGVSGDFAMGWGQRRLPYFVWQLATANDHGPHPHGEPPTPEDPPPCLFWACRITLPVAKLPWQREDFWRIGWHLGVRISAMMDVCLHRCVIPV